MNCLHCRSLMHRGDAPFQIDKKGYHLTLESVPAWICSQCGEVYFEEAEVEAIQNVIRSLDTQTEKLESAQASSPS